MKLDRTPVGQAVTEETLRDVDEKLLGLADSTVKRILKEMAEKELLIVEGERKARKYLKKEK